MEEVFLAKLSTQTKVKRNLMVTLPSPLHGEPSRWTTSSAPLHQSDLYDRVVRHKAQSVWSLPNSIQRTLENTKTVILWSGTAHHLANHHPHFKAWWFQHDAIGEHLHKRNGSVLNEGWMQPNTERSLMKTCPIVHSMGDCENSPFSTTMQSIQPSLG